MAPPSGACQISVYFADLLRRCADLCHGEAVHAAAAKFGLAAGCDRYVTAALVEMYCLCGGAAGAAVRAFEEIPAPPPVSWNATISSLFRAGHCASARSLFDRMPCRNAVTWSAVVAGYAQNRRGDEAMLVFKKMIQETVSARSAPPQLLAGVLSACKELREVAFITQVHGYAAKVSCYVEDDGFVGSVLLDAYAKCDELALARRVFDGMSQKSVVAWSSLMSSLVRDGSPLMAMGLLKEMIQAGVVSPNDFTLATALSACAHLPDMAAGVQLHAYILRRRREEAPDIFVSSALIDMYCKCGSLDRALSVFQGESGLLGGGGSKKAATATPLWNTMIAGYVANGRVYDAWRMIRSMSPAAPPNAVTLAVILPLCATTGRLLRQGKEAHGYAVRNDLEGELLVGNSLLDMYCKCGEIGNAAKHFELMPAKNRISWTTLIDGYGMHGGAAEAVRAFRRMAAEGTARPDEITFVALISACSHGGLVEEGLDLFKELKEGHGLALTAEVCGAMVDLLARAGRLEEAREFMAATPGGAGKSAMGALLSGCRIYGEVNGAESTARGLAELEPEGTGFPALLSCIYAEKGMMDRAAELAAIRGLAKKRAYSCVETRETPKSTGQS